MAEVFDFFPKIVNISQLKNFKNLKFFAFDLRVKNVQERKEKSLLPIENFHSQNAEKVIDQLWFQKPSCKIK